MLILKNNIPYNIMVCSNNSRCANFYLIKVDSYHICLSRNVMFEKGKKVLINCCRNQIINNYTNIQYCIFIICYI